jgi:hypothetical protein
MLVTESLICAHNDMPFEKGGRKRFRKEISGRLWPSEVRERVLAKLEGLDKEANAIREDEQNFVDFVVLVAEENRRVFIGYLLLEIWNG